MLTSVIIPTHNRAKTLLLCLDALSELNISPEIYEIIIVDNCSTDTTRDTCLNFAKTNPSLQIRYIFEEKQGVSFARNRGVIESRGEIVCFLDDDSPPTTEWLASLLKPFADPNVGCVGGPSILDFQGQQIPPWLRGDLQVYLSAYGLPYTKPTQVSRWEHYPYSCNMAIRRNMFNHLGYFRTDLDRTGNQVLAAGDTEMAERIFKAGWKVIYVPNAPVRHLVPPERLTKDHIYRIGRGLAESHIIITSDPRPHLIARWFASDLWYATRMFFGFVIAVVRRKPLWFDDYIRFWIVAMRIPIRLRVVFRRSAGKDI